MPTPTVVLLGNENPQHLHPGETSRRQAEHLNQSVTRVELWDGIDDRDMVAHALSTDNDRDLINRASALADEHNHYAIAVHEIEELWPIHSGVKPAYVASSDPELQKVLASYYGIPEGQYVGLLTNVGRDALHQQHLGTSAQPAAFTFGAISTNNGSGFTGTDTTLASELTTNGLARAATTFAHTTGTNTSTATHTWTYTGTGSVVIASFANFNASSAGTIGEEDPLASSVTVVNSGDTATVTLVLTAG